MINLWGLAGKGLPTLVLSLSFLGMASGLAIRQPAQKKQDRTIERVMQVLVVIVLLTLLSGTIGWWLPGMALSAIAILLMVISVRLAIA